MSLDVPSLLTKQPNEDEFELRRKILLEAINQFELQLNAKAESCYPLRKNALEDAGRAMVDL